MKIDIPDPEDFSRDEKPRKYRAYFRVTGEIWADIEADSEGDAQVKAQEMAQSDDFGFELDDLGDVEITYVHKMPAMFRVIRDGREMQVSRLEPGDKPREPRQDGF